MFAVIMLLACVICTALTFLSIEVKAMGWWVWATGAVVFFLVYLAQIQS